MGPQNRISMLLLHRTHVAVVSRLRPVSRRCRRSLSLVSPRRIRFSERDPLLQTRAVAHVLIVVSRSLANVLTVSNCGDCHRCTTHVSNNIGDHGGCHQHFVTTVTGTCTRSYVTKNTRWTKTLYNFPLNVFKSRAQKYLMFACLILGFRMFFIAFLVIACSLFN